MPLVSFLRSFAWPLLPAAGPQPRWPLPLLAPLLPSPNLAATPNRALPPLNRAPAPSMSSTGARAPRRAGETRQDRQWREAGRYCEEGADLGARAAGDLWPALQVGGGHPRRRARRPSPTVAPPFSSTRAPAAGSFSFTQALAAASFPSARPAPSPPRGLLFPARSRRSGATGRERDSGGASDFFRCGARGGWSVVWLGEFRIFFLGGPLVKNLYCGKNFETPGPNIMGRKD
jgi:hypothetical protein